MKWRAMDRVIQKLDVKQFRNFKSWITDKGNDNPVFVASFRHPMQKKLMDMYVKIYPLDYDDRCIFNEILGYLMANELGIPQPTYACIAMIPTDIVKKNDTIGFCDTPLGKQFLQNSSYPVFCTARIHKNETAFEYHQRTKKLVAELEKWKFMASTIALDNTIAHIDRHTNNLLRTGRNTYHIIDNGLLVGHYKKHGWKTTDLQAKKLYPNKLYDIAKTCMKEKAFNTINSNMVQMADTHVDAVENILDELRYWTNVLYNQNPNDYNVFIDFLIDRANNAFTFTRTRAELFI